jgi:hypothetical protein
MPAATYPLLWRSGTPMSVIPGRRWRSISALSAGRQTSLRPRRDARQGRSNVALSPAQRHFSGGLLA